jgi:hypothetical protein
MMVMRFIPFPEKACKANTLQTQVHILFHPALRTSLCHTLQIRTCDINQASPSASEQRDFAQAAAPEAQRTICARSRLVVLLNFRYPFASSSREHIR